MGAEVWQDAKRMARKASARPIRRATASKPAMTGKFLPFKYYGATGDQQAYGFKEEGE